MTPIEFGSAAHQLITEINASVALLRVNNVAPIQGRYECYLDTDEASEFAAIISGQFMATPEEESKLRRLMRGDGFSDFEGLLVKERAGSLSNFVTGQTHFVELRTEVKSLAANT